MGPTTHLKGVAQQAGGHTGEEFQRKICIRHVIKSSYVDVNMIPKERCKNETNGDRETHHLQDEQEKGTLVHIRRWTNRWGRKERRKT